MRGNGLGRSEGPLSCAGPLKRTAAVLTRLASSPMGVSGGSTQLLLQGVVVVGESQASKRRGLRGVKNREQKSVLLYDRWNCSPRNERWWIWRQQFL